MLTLRFLLSLLIVEQSLRKRDDDIRQFRGSPLEGVLGVAFVELEAFADLITLFVKKVRVKI
jgi:hypothetical protein